MMNRFLAAIFIGAALVAPGPAAAGGFVLGWHRGLGFEGGPPVAIYPAPYPYVDPYYAGPAYVPFAADRSYFRPFAPYGWNAGRNWRDTWQDDGVKVHSYTWH